MGIFWLCSTAVGFGCVESLDRFDAFSVIYLGVIQLGLSYLLFTKAMALE
jgi:hypothetical protein